MTFSLHESIDPNAVYELIEQARQATAPPDNSREGTYVIREKIRPPVASECIERPRLTKLLAKSVEQFPATLISGRAGTGKTCIAAEFVRGRRNVAWFTIEASDTSWASFSRYFSECLTELPSVPDDGASDEVRAMHVPQTDIGRYLLHQLNRISDVERPLIVLDDIHHVFDVPWFDDFFRLLLFSLPQDGHVIMLCRSRPPGPLWRLRSKQMLNVLDEKVIAFSDAEARKLFEAKGVSTRLVGEAQRHAFGRISKLLAFTDAVTG